MHEVVKAGLREVERIKANRQLWPRVGRFNHRQPTLPLAIACVAAGSHLQSTRIAAPVKIALVDHGNALYPEPGWLGTLASLSAIKLRGYSACLAFRHGLASDQVVARH